MRIKVVVITLYKEALFAKTQTGLLYMDVK